MAVTSIGIQYNAREFIHTAANSVEFSAFEPVGSIYHAVLNALDEMYFRLEGRTVNYDLGEYHADMMEAHQQYRHEVRGMENPPTFEQWLAEDDFPEDILSFLLHEGGTITLATLVQEFIADEDEREMEAKIESALVGLVGEGIVQQVAPSAWRANTEYIAYCEEQAREYEERGELAGAPREMGCHPCHLAAGNQPELDDSKVVQRKVVKLGPVAGSDPTQTYVLECGHTAF